MAELNRRDFLKVMGITGTASACAIDPMTPVEQVLPYVVTPDQIIPGGATWFATQCTACSAGCGVLAKNREGRIIKLEGEAARYYLKAANSAVWRALEKRSKNAAELRKLVFPDIAG